MTTVGAAASVHVSGVHESAAASFSDVNMLLNDGNTRDDWEKERRRKLKNLKGTSLPFLVLPKEGATPSEVLEFCLKLKLPPTIGGIARIIRAAKMREEPTEARHWTTIEVPCGEEEATVRLVGEFDFDLKPQPGSEIRRRPASFRGRGHTTFVRHPEPIGGTAA